MFKKNAAPSTGYNLTNSLRFRSSASAYLNRTPASAGNRQIFTWSGWVKKAVVGSSTNNVLFCSTDNSTGTGWLHFNTGNYGSADTLTFEDQASSTALVTTQVFRDVSAWYHIVLAVDTTQATNTNRIKLYVNGLQITAFSTSTYPSQNANTNFNRTSFVNSIGCYFTGTSSFFDGYLAEVNFIDGQALTPSSFGETSATTGVWIPKKYTGTYGTNGFYLPFTDVATTSGSNAGLGKDFSGNSNYFNTNNISVTSGSTYDSMKDVPTLTDTDTANYCVLNPLNLPKGGTLSNGNLLWTAPSAEGQAVGTMYVSSGKFYWEMVLNTAGAGCAFGIASITTDINNINLTAGSYAYYTNGNKYNGGSGSAYGATFTNGDIIGVALDLDAGTLVFYKNNTSQGTAFTGLSGTFTALIYDGTSASAPTYTANFGQRPFAYTPPSGFKALNTFNLPTPTIGATASSQAGKYFNTVLYTGNGSTQSVTGVGFQPDFTWIKERDAIEDHFIFDAVRGATKYIRSNTTDAEGTLANYLTSFDSNGFSLGNGGGVNGTSDLYVAWNWKANGSGSTNTAGSITSTVSANTTAGFSIVTWAGNSTNGATIGHGLGVAPKLLITKSRTNPTSWVVGIGNIAGFGVNDYLTLNTTGSKLSTTTFYQAYGSSTFTVGVSAADEMNKTGNNYVTYCFAQVAGYSAFGSYTGNGSTDGPFVFTGFRPRFVLVKESSAAGNNWVIYDTARDTYNECSKILYPNLSNAEFDGSTVNLDILSNGFKPRDNWGGNNNSGSTYIYMAFAESPFKYANAR